MELYGHLSSQCVVCLKFCNGVLKLWKCVIFFPFCTAVDLADKNLDAQYLAVLSPRAGPDQSQI